MIRKRDLFCLFAASTPSIATACGTANGASSFDPPPSAPAGLADAGSSGSLSADGASGAGSLLGEDAAATEAFDGGCSAASQLVYLLSSTGDLYSFDPQQKIFSKIAPIPCQPAGMTTNSMAVDRNGFAWVNFYEPNGTAGSVLKVSTTDGSCSTGGIALPSGWGKIGMGFATASATDPTDTLYVAAQSTSAPGCLSGVTIPGFDASIFGGAGTSAGLGSLDTGSGMLQPIGQFTADLAGQNAELTGTGDGRLFGFFVLSPVKVAAIDRTSGATSSEVTMSGVPCPQAWAFSFWGGDLYMYTSADGTTDSTVSHYASASKTLDTSYIADAGFVIVGAGISTCAPLTPPPPR